MTSLNSVLVLFYCMMSLKNQDLRTSGMFISNSISKEIVCNTISYHDLGSGNNRNLFFVIALKKEPMANIPRSIC